MDSDTVLDWPSRAPPQSSARTHGTRSASARSREGAASQFAGPAPDHGEEREQGYLVWGCKNCRGYIKELDRRVRWNGRSGLIEDWGSPHFDLVAMQSGYRRPIPSLIQLARSARGGR